jgi:hypothetical protein
MRRLVAKRCGRLLPAMDFVTRRWLMRSRSPYTAEIHGIAAELGFQGSGFSTGAISGVVQRLPANRGSYLGLRARSIALSGTWMSCRSCAYAWYRRRFRQCDVARICRRPNSFGCGDGSPPAINQAPMRRRTGPPWLRPYDMALNATQTWGIRAIPPLTICSATSSRPAPLTPKRSTVCRRR